MTWVEITTQQVRKGDRIRLNAGLDFTIQEVVGRREPFLVIIDTLGERMRIMDSDLLERFQRLEAQFCEEL